jgi:hypothetical protein
MVTKLIGLTGYARSGKDTVGRYLVQEHGFTRLAFADAVRDAVLTFDAPVKTEYGYVRLSHIIHSDGWDAAKVRYDEVRRQLQVMGTEVGRMLFGENVWVDIVKQKMEGLDLVVITDVRFANEADFIHEYGGLVWRVERSGVKPVNAHASENLDFEPDVVIYNDSDLPTLFRSVEELLAELY